MNETHLDIFSGLGGFAIAAREAGFQTVAFCESDERCRVFLEKSWGLTVEPDIRKLDGRKYAGVSLLTGGPPCQPASRAGKQGGARDDRWLWDDALRVLAEARPDYVVFENPPGILDVGIDGILSEMGRLGYETQPFDIPACAMDSPQLRHRIWIVGFLADSNERGQQERWAEGSSSHEGRNGAQEPNALSEPSRSNDLAESDENGRSAREPTESAARYRDSIESEVSSSLADSRCQRSGENQPGQRESGRAADRRDSENKLADAAKQGSEGQRRWRNGHDTEPIASPWSNSVWVPCADGKLRRAPDDSFSVVDGLHRSILGALGNSIVPQVAVEILKAVRKNL